MIRFGNESASSIAKEIEQLVPNNTRRSKVSVWKQFMQFCGEKSYNVSDPSISIANLASILKDWAFNMKKQNSEDYKENVIKLMWNSTAKQLQEYYFTTYKIKFDPFKDIEFLEARAARDTKRRKLQMDVSKRKKSSSALSTADYSKMVHLWDEDTPEGLQKKFFFIVAHELAWRGGEGVNCCIHYFIEEMDKGYSTGRIEYNPVFSKTTQGGSKKLADSKFLIKNVANPEMCPVRLFKKLMEKRSMCLITTDRLFLTPNLNWKVSNKWYKNSPIGKNTISTWFKQSAAKIGIDTKRTKVTNHSARATAVTSLAQSGVEEQQLIKITGHSSSQSIKPYLQMNSSHHQKIIESMRQIQASETTTSAFVEQSNNASISDTSSRVVYNNCVFNINTKN